jgi:hypothetical protein
MREKAEIPLIFQNAGAALCRNWHLVWKLEVGNWKLENGNSLLSNL